MDINDILRPPDAIKRPEHPDFWRMSEISMQLRAELQNIPYEDKERVWRERVSGICDFDSIAYHAIQVGMSIAGIVTGADWLGMQRNKRKAREYVSTVQAFYDGFIMGALFEQRGGHQEQS